MEYLKSFRYIVADEYHYLLTDAKVIDGTAWFVLQYSWRVRCPFCVVWVW